MATPSGASRCPRIAALVVLAPLMLGVLIKCAEPTTLLVQSLTLEAAPDAVLLDARAGRAFVASAADASVSVLALTPLRLLRIVRVGDRSTVAPLAMALDPATHHLFVADRGDPPMPGLVQAVQVLDSRTGARLARVRVGRETSAVAIDTSCAHLFVANEADGTVSMIDARRLSVQRTTAVGLAPVALAVDARTARAFVLGPATPGALSLPAQYGPTDALLAVLDTRSGALLRRTPLGGGVSVLAVDERRGRVFVVNATAGTVSVLDAHDGTLIQTVTLGGEPETLAVDERRGYAYIVDALDGVMSVLDTRSGALVRTVRVDVTPNAVYPPPYALAVDETHDRVYLTTWGALAPVAGQGLTLAGAGTLVVLDARTGAVRRAITVGVAPQAIAVAGGSGRVVVVNGGGEVVNPATNWLAQGTQRLRGWLPWLPPTPSAVQRAPGSVTVLDART